MRVLLSVVAAAVVLMPFASYAVDTRSAQKLARSSGCLKCHAISKKKEGPPYKEIAAKYKGKPDAVATIIKQMTSEPMVEVDGKKEKHKKIESSDQAEIKNLAEWILSR